MNHEDVDKTTKFDPYQKALEDAVIDMCNCFDQGLENAGDCMDGLDYKYKDIFDEMVDELGEKEAARRLINEMKKIPGCKGWSSMMEQGMNASNSENEYEYEDYEGVEENMDYYDDYGDYE